MLGPSEMDLIKDHFSFWEHISDAEKEILLNHSHSVEYKKGSLLHSGDRDCVGVHVIKNGSLRVYMLSEEGKEITLYRLGEGDVCILSASCLLSEIAFDVHISAETDCSVILVNSSVFSKLANQNIYVENYIYKVTAERFSDVMWAMQQILFMSFDKRLAIFLNDEIVKTKSDTINMTHDQIAKYIGSAREVVSRMLKYFSNEGIVELSRGGIKVLDKKRLSKLIET